MENNKGICIVTDLKSEENEPLYIPKRLMEFMLVELSLTLFSLDEKASMETVERMRFVRLKRLYDLIDGYLLDCDN